ncbi:MAG: ABC transporter substrate-binding protein [Gammaproteobacteria bacterium]
MPSTAAMAAASPVTPPRRQRRHGTAVLLATAVFAIAQAAAAPPQRIASLNLCTDSMLFELVDDRRIASVTTLSRDPNLSHFAERAAHRHVNHGAVEEILFTAPDLVIGDRQLAPQTARLLRRLDLPLLQFDHANTFDEYAANLGRLAAAIGAEMQAASILASLHHALGDGPAGVSAAAPRAIIYQPNGYTPGTATLMHDILRHAGLRDIADELGLAFGGFITLEQLIMARPEILIFSARRTSAPSLAEQQLRHPVLRRARALAAPTTVARIPEHLWTCAGLFSVAAIRALEVHAP